MTIKTSSDISNLPPDFIFIQIISQPWYLKTSTPNYPNLHCTQQPCVQCCWPDISHICVFVMFVRIIFYFQVSSLFSCFSNWTFITHQQMKHTYTQPTQDIQFFFSLWSVNRNDSEVCHQVRLHWITQIYKISTILHYNKLWRGKVCTNKTVSVIVISAYVNSLTVWHYNYLDNPSWWAPVAEYNIRMCMTWDWLSQAQMQCSKVTVWCNKHIISLVRGKG